MGVVTTFTNDQGPDAGSPIRCVPVRRASLAGTARNAGAGGMPARRNAMTAGRRVASHRGAIAQPLWRITWAGLVRWPA